MEAWLHDPPVPFEQRADSPAFVQSNCFAASGRDATVGHLMKFKDLNIRSYGRQEPGRPPCACPRPSLSLSRPPEPCARFLGPKQAWGTRGRTEGWGVQGCGDRPTVECGWRDCPWRGAAVAGSQRSGRQVQSCRALWAGATTRRAAQTARARARWPSTGATSSASSW